MVYTSLFLYITEISLHVTLINHSTQPKVNVEKRNGKFGKAGLNNKSISKSQKGRNHWCPEAFPDATPVAYAP